MIEFSFEVVLRYRDPRDWPADDLERVHNRLAEVVRAVLDNDPRIQVEVSPQ
jgi:hypothetical protein